VKIIPDNNEIIGRIVDIVRSEGGLELPASKNNATVFAKIDAVGPDVTKYKPGQIVLPNHMSHIYVRGGFHRIIFTETETRAHVEELDEAQISIEGAPPPPARVNGRPEVSGEPV
jgi:hypothetical protein